MYMYMYMYIYIYICKMYIIFTGHMDLDKEKLRNMLILCGYTHQGKASYHTLVA